MWIDWAHLIELPKKTTADTQRWSEEHCSARFIPHCCFLLPTNCPGLVSISSSQHPLLRHIPIPLLTSWLQSRLLFPWQPWHPRWTKTRIKQQEMHFYLFSSVSAPQEHHSLFLRCLNTLTQVNTQVRRAPWGQGTWPTWTKTKEGAQERVKDEDTTSHQFHNKEEVGFES